ncbi:hypothetical protein BV898_11523 [Hypsibius exemplaris]|uniref:F-box domain-containing protein n=1 Tax=Hypsibius exemplaris TaxID=2072580 RepID=A0A1W0WGF3_HYPEX|nr:hypothetical protein BV898_11523 [Hypsibius exemplaris]
MAGNVTKRAFGAATDEEPNVAAQFTERNKRKCISPSSQVLTEKCRREGVPGKLEPVETLQLMQAKQLQLDHLRQTIQEKSVQAKQLPLQIVELQRLIGEKEQEMDGLRYWAPRTTFRDFSAEQLTVLLQFVDLPHQHRLRRISKRWRHLLSSPDFLDQSYLILTTTRINSAEKSYKTEPCNRDRLWKLLRSGIHGLTIVRHLTFVARPGEHSYVSNLSLAHDYVEAFVDRCRRLESYTVAGLEIVNRPRFELFLSSCGRGLPYHPRGAISDTFVLALPISSVGLPKSLVGPMRSMRSGMTHRPVGMDSIVNGFVRLPAMDLAKTPVVRQSEFSQAVDRLVWPFPEAQLEWLARSAWSLNVFPNVVTWLDELFQVDMPLNDQTARPTVSCPEHREFCDHLDVDFYRELNGPFRYLLALCILRKNVQTEPPPFEMAFEQYDFDKHHRPYRSDKLKR